MICTAYTELLNLCDQSYLSVLKYLMKYACSISQFIISSLFTHESKLQKCKQTIQIVLSDTK